jgi:hypothetical protein
MATNERISSLYLKVNDLSINESQINDKCVKCLICENVFDNKDKSESIAIQLQTHLLTKHNLLIAEIESISDLSQYCDHWRTKLSDCHDLSQFCAVINTNW